METSFEVISPIDGSLVETVEYSSEEEALAQLSRSEAAARAFKKTTVRERVELLKSVLDAFDAKAGDYALEVSRAMGKPVAQALGEIRGMRERSEALCLQAPHALAPQLLPEKDGLNRFIRREPLGVVLDIAAWNYPYVVAINVVAPAILAGNAVLLKHSHQTAVVARQFEEAFKKAGAPAGLFQNLVVSHETVAALVATNRIHHVGFTGSVRGGSEVYAAVSRSSFASCGLEMGGKDAAIVLDDADVKAAAISLCDGAFYNAGQSCCGVERIYVPAALQEEFVEEFVAETHRLKLGDPRETGISLGPVVDARAAARIAAQVKDALAAGAKQVSDDSVFSVPTNSPCYLPPRVLTGVDHSMSLMTEESFGPVIGIMSYETIEEAIALANDSPFGLTASVWSNNEERAIAVCDQLEVGTVYLNRCDAVDADLPWVGAKDSGLGFTLSSFGIQALTRPKSYNLKPAK